MDVWQTLTVPETLPPFSISCALQPLKPEYLQVKGYVLGNSDVSAQDTLVTTIRQLNFARGRSMRRYLTKQCVTLGALLLLGPVCSHAHAQAPRRLAAGPGQYTVAPSMATPQPYAPPPFDQGSLGLSAVAPPSASLAYEQPQPVARASYPQPQSNTRRSMPAAVESPPPSQPASGPYHSAFMDPDQRTAGSKINGPPTLNRPRDHSRRAPAPDRALQPTPAGAVGGPTSGIPIATVQPAGGPLARLVRAQTPVALPQGPVVVYMPPGWQPPGGEIAFTPRETDPEVPADFWPESTRNPLGDSDSGGLFRWPKFTRPNSPDTLPSQTADRATAKALVSSAHSTPPSKAPATEGPRQPWDILLGTSSGDQARQPGVKSKALLSIARSTQPSAAPAASAQVAQAPPASIAKPSGVQAPVAAPAAAASAPVAPQQAASRLKTPALADAQPPVAETEKGQLKWRAKGAPSTASPAAEPSSSDRSHMQMAAHTQPVEPTPAGAGAPANAIQSAAPGEATPTAPIENPPQAPPAAKQKSLIPKSIMTGKSANGAAIPQAPPEPAFVLTSAPKATKALANIAAPRAAEPTAAESQPAPAMGGKALVPNMFVKNLATQVNLATKPAAAPPDVGMPRAARPVYIVVQPQAASETIESYYAPPVTALSTGPRNTPAVDGFSSNTARSHSAGRERSQARSDMARSERERAANSRSYGPPDDIPPLARPFWAIGELTKLPRFLTGRAHDRSELPRPPSYPQTYRATIARRADPDTDTPDRATRDEGLHDEEMAEQGADAAPDVSVELPSKRRNRANATTREKPRDHQEPREHNELAAEPKSKLTPREELDQLYQSAVAVRAEPKKPEPKDDAVVARRDTNDDDEKAIATAARDEKPSRRANVPAVAIEESDGTTLGRSKTTQIQKADGSNVTVYHVGAAAGEANQGAVDVSQPSKPRNPVRRQLVRETDDADTKTRRNPLR